MKDNGGHWNWKKFLIIFSMVLVVGVSSFYIYQSGFSHAVELNGKIVGYVKNVEDVEEALDLVKKEVAKEHGKEAHFKHEVLTERVRGHNEDRIELEELDKNITDNIEIYRPASIVLIDDKEEIIIESKEDAESVLEEIKNFYIEEREEKNNKKNEEDKDKKDKKDIEIAEVEFKQDIEIVDKDVLVNEILAKEEVLSALGIKDSEVRTDRMARGNSALGISRSLSSRRTDSEEELKDSEEILKSLVEVEMIEKHTHTEKVDFKTEEKKDSSIYKGEKEVKQEGKKGKKKITTEVTYINGKETSKEVVEEKVTTEPKNKIILVGTKERPRPAAQTVANRTTTNTRSSSRNSNSVNKTSAKKSTSRGPAPTYNGSRGASIVATAKGYLGTPYVYGGSSPSGFDCSGFTSYVYRQYGISLPRSSGAQGSYGAYVSKSQLQPGDIVAFPGHVGIYIGGGNMIHSPRPGKSVEITSINNSYFKNRFLSGRRPY